MDFKNIDDIKKYGFTGFKTVRELWDDKSFIPNIKGVYLVMTPTLDEPTFVNPGLGPKLYKKKTNPNVSLEELNLNWVNETSVVYIGKAGGFKKDGTEMDATLRSRLRTYLNFGLGKDVRHYGGRYIWQIKDAPNLIFCWKPTPKDDPRKIEKLLFEKFIHQFGQRSFANLTG